MAPLIQELNADTTRRGRGLIDLRLELRKSARLLLGEIRALSPDPPQPGDQPPTGNSSRSVVAVTYGRRPSRDGTATWYTHAFTWSQPDGAITVHGADPAQRPK